MALIACKECGRMISKRAKTCPQCGARNRYTSRLTWIVVSGCVLIFYSFNYVSKHSEVSPHKAVVQKTPETSSPGNPAEYDVWVTSDNCWVVEEPSAASTVVGAIKGNAVVTIKDDGGEWLKIIYAPVRDMVTGNFIECPGYYIRKKDTTKTPPQKR
ncbi:MAG: zinc-ribbon domain-containing protein [Candidatus Scalindua sp.]|jgi:hypothetical protein|nr:zinc-ribbon domain-containing protein [Candidatus Scalindua sp.]MBT6048278.1 zinc-ribbon domain-containing protein [Candidatus Scalindua sp.]